MNCPACKKPIREGAHFCTHCGTHIVYESVDGYDDDYPYEESYEESYAGYEEEDPGYYVEHDDYALEPVGDFEVQDLSQPPQSFEDEHSIPPADDVNASAELEAILARLTSAQDSETEPQHAEAAAPQDDFVLGGDFSDPDIPFVLGNDDDSGPIPVSAEDVENERRERERTLNGEEKPAMRDLMRDWLLRARERSQAIPRQVVVAVIAAILVFGIGYAVLSGGDETASDSESAADDEGGLSVVTDIEGAASQPVRPAEAALADLLEDEGDEDGGAEFELIVPDPENDAGGAAAQQEEEPEEVVAHDDNPANAFKGKPLSSKEKGMPHPCVLREGPASKFRLVESLVRKGTPVVVIAKSEGNWKTVTKGERSGWAKGSCKGNSCDIRRGPGEGFKRVTGPDNSVKPRRPVISSSRWRYLKVGNAYGWTGPACWK